jgi:hypothetical protein
MRIQAAASACGTLINGWGGRRGKENKMSK